MGQGGKNRIRARRYERFSQPGRGNKPERLVDFDDLDFQPHENLVGIFRAYKEFSNGYAVSVITEPNNNYGHADSREEYERLVANHTAGHTVNPYSPDRYYEVAIMNGGNIVYDIGIGGEDVIRYQTQNEVTEVMRKVNSLPRRER